MYNIPANHLKCFSWTLDFQEFSGIGGALSYGATSTRLRHLYKHDIVHMYIHVVQCSLSRCHTVSRRCEGVTTRDCKINSTSTCIYTRIHVLYCYVLDSALYLGPAWDVKLQKRLDVCAHGFWARARDKYTGIIIIYEPPEGSGRRSH